MQTPTITQLESAIQVLQKFSECLNNDAAHSATQLPRSQLGSDYAGRIETRATEQILRIAAVAEQLETWSNELNRATEQPAFNYV
jgi:N-acetylglucosamine-6-phosphate deacetylase